MFSRLRSILTHSRVPLKVDAAQNASNVYRVRFVKPRPKSGAKFLYVVGTTVITVMLGFRVVQVMGMGGQPLFIPLGFAKQEEPQKFKKDDPEVKAFIKFGSNRALARKARRVFEDKTVQILRTSLAGQLGPQIRAIHSLLYFHYPHGPPPGYRQKGLQFVYRQLDPTSMDPEDQQSVLEVGYAERRMEADRYLRRESIIFPRWMFYAVKNSLLDIWADITSPRDPNEEEKIEDVFGLVQYGMDLSQWTLANLKDDLKRTRMRLPPPSGHVIIDGMVQVTSNNMLVTVDLTGSFNPENPEQATVHRMSVRFVSKFKPPPKKRISDVGNSLDLGREVVSGLKKDIDSAKVVTKGDDKNLEKPKNRDDGGQKRDLGVSTSPDIVGRLVKSNTGVGDVAKVLDTEKTKDDAQREALRLKSREHAPRQTAVPKDIENSPPPTPSESQPSPPSRE
ncbi:hypothetical protein BDD12DRAFT_298014 [Trichophaea hybrida]|nr:hypothetical protein BDD12DRAFT_298014 [Trichophaea hybrida]